jgi:hypothetical protein
MGRSTSIDIVQVEHWIRNDVAIKWSSQAGSPWPPSCLPPAVDQAECLSFAGYRDSGTRRC